MLTAFSQRELIEQARDAGAMAYLVKPFARHELVPAIELAVVAVRREARAGGRGRHAERAAGDPQGRRPGQGPADDPQQMTEPEAFRWIQRTAMDRRTTMKAVAEAVVEGLATPRA